MSVEYRNPIVAAEFLDNVRAGSESAGRAYDLGVTVAGGARARRLLVPSDAALASLARWVGLRFEVACDDLGDPDVRRERLAFGRLYGRIHVHDSGADSYHVGLARNITRSAGPPRSSATP